MGLIKKPLYEHCAEMNKTYLEHRLPEQHPQGKEQQNLLLQQKSKLAKLEKRQQQWIESFTSRTTDLGSDEKRSRSFEAALSNFDRSLELLRNKIRELEDSSPQEISSPVWSRAFTQLHQRIAPCTHLLDTLSSFSSQENIQPRQHSKESSSSTKLMIQKMRDIPSPAHETTHSQKGAEKFPSDENNLVLLANTALSLGKIHVTPPLGEHNTAIDSASSHKWVEERRSLASTLNPY